MKFPIKLKIGGHEYNVILSPKCANSDEHISEGNVNSDSGIITIENTLMESEKERCLIHEIFHVLNNELNHELIESLSQQWYQVLKDNNLHFANNQKEKRL